MTKTWVVADLHFGHPNIVTFKRPDGTQLRPFPTWQEHDEFIINAWNYIVRPEDRVYLLGDVCIRRRELPKLGRLLGRKVLVKGNHDIFKLNDYLKYFDDIRGCVVKKGCIMTHIPVHPSQLNRFGVNIHGHTHFHRVMHSLYGEYPDERYKCVSLEHTNWKPVLLQDLIK